MTFPDVQGSFLRFELQAPVNRTGNTWHIQARLGKRGLQEKGLAVTAGPTRRPTNWNPQPFETKHREAHPSLGSFDEVARGRRNRFQ